MARRRRTQDAVDVTSLNGAARQIEFLRMKGKDTPEACTRCIESWLDSGDYMKSNEEIMRDINSLKIVVNGREDAEKTVAARRMLFEKKLADYGRYEFIDGKVRKV